MMMIAALQDIALPKHSNFTSTCSVFTLQEQSYDESSLLEDDPCICRESD